MLALVSNFDARSQAMSPTTPTVFIVDDDASVRESLDALVQYAGWRCETFETAREFLLTPSASGPSCLLLDVGLPDLNGLELQERIGSDRSDMPIIFITGNCDIPVTVKAMKAGAIEFLVKPLSKEALLVAMRNAIARSAAQRDLNAAEAALRARYASLTSREREVMKLVTAGMLNKQVGGELGITEITVKAHRGRVMQKMQARSLADLVKMTWGLNLAPAERQGCHEQEE
ncbi:response regulator transcription factor [Rhizobium lentis]|uniref:response regulator transcription factor n=2 Tax=Rhizobium lentis TaxID=1138194 RepID=UPI002180D0E7|nr:response regulator [Rhizobium lentis]